MLTFLLTYLLTYLLTHSLTHSLTYLLNYVLTYLFVSCLLTYLLTYSLTHSLTHSINYLRTYLLTHSLTYSFTYSHTPWSRVLLEKLTSSQLGKNSPDFMEPKSSLQNLQLPTTCPYPEPDQSTLSPQIPLHESSLENNWEQHNSKKSKLLS